MLCMSEHSQYFCFHFHADNVRSKVKKSSTVDGLSVESLILLERVHVARVTIDNLHLIGHDLNSSTNKPKSKTRYGVKPPRPSPKAKKSWYIFSINICKFLQVHKDIYTHFLHLPQCF